MHGGRSPGPPKGTQNALKHGMRTAEAVAMRKRGMQARRNIKKLVVLVEGALAAPREAG